MFSKLVLLISLIPTLLLKISFAEEVPVYVVESETNLCGEFIIGTNENPNWLPAGWKAVLLDNELDEKFISSLSCQNSEIINCCRGEGFRYAGVDIGVENIPEDRKSAEFLSAQNIINNYSLDPDSYNLNSFISRKEVMKVIINTSPINPNTSCQEIFVDVNDDWGCKYIEAALEHEYITGNLNFRPDDRLSKTEALKLIFKARGIEKAYNTNSWQEDYISSALYYGYIDEKYKNFNEFATRGWIFQALARSYDEFEGY